VIRPRLVKGAYLGDFREFYRVQNNFKALLDIGLTARRPFCAGTQDPELLAWMKDRALQDKSQVEFAFLKGLGDETKHQMAKEK
jgi:proline dehydrogenase